MVKVLILEDGMDPGSYSQESIIAILYSSGKMIIRQTSWENNWIEFDEIILDKEGASILKREVEKWNPKINCKINLDKQEEVGG